MYRTAQTFSGGDAACLPGVTQGFRAAIRMNDKYPGQDAGDKDQDEDAERAVADAPATGDARVDDAVAGLTGLRGRPADEHVAILEEVHGRLRDILDELAEGSGPEQR
jgi:hypothetical protein